MTTIFYIGLSLPTQEVKDLKNKVKQLEKEKRDLEKKMRGSEIQMSRSITKLDLKAGKTDKDLEKYKTRYEETKKKLTTQLEACKEHSDKLKKLERAGKAAEGEITQLRKTAEEYEDIKIAHSKLQKELKAKLKIAVFSPNFLFLTF